MPTLLKHPLTRPGYGQIASASINGTFTISNLAAGRYHLCGQATQPNQTSDCAWLGVPVLILGPGQAIQNQSIKVLGGTIITLQVGDASSRISIPDANGNFVFGRRFFIGVSVGNYYQRAERISSSATQHVFRLVIPKQQPVRLFIDSDFTVTDSVGRLIETKRPSSLQLSPGELRYAIVHGNSQIVG